MSGVAATPAAQTTHSTAGLLSVNTICVQQFSSGRECSVRRGCRLIKLQIVIVANVFPRNTFHRVCRALMKLLFPNVTTGVDIHNLRQERGRKWRQPGIA